MLLKHPVPWLLLFVLIGAGLAGCGSTSDDHMRKGADQAAPAGELGIKPPPALLHIGDVEQAAGIGSYCWTEAGQSLCADAGGIATPTQPLIASSPLTAALRLPLQQAPSELQLHIQSVTPADELGSQAQNYRWWRFREAPRTPLLALAEQELTLSLEPGLYVLRVPARWDGVGDVLYGFLIEVR